MATCNKCGRPLILSNGKCVYCGAIPNQTSTPKGERIEGRITKQIIQRRSLANQPKSISDLRIRVTSPNYDDIGKILYRLDVNYSSFDGTFDCDVLFLNCGTSDFIDTTQLNSFVQRGGVLYASDLTSDILMNTWPEIMDVLNDTEVCTIQAIIEDPDLKFFLGNTISIEFDLSCWSRIVDAPQGKVLMRSAKDGFPIMMEFTIGQGKVLYTSFHNHAQTADSEKRLLQLLVIKQISTATKQDFRKTVQSMPFNI